ncbi:33991_t:CDS:2, partial [Racocetra persica]
ATFLKVNKITKIEEAPDGDKLLEFNANCPQYPETSTVESSVFHIGKYVSNLLGSAMDTAIKDFIECDLIYIKPEIISVFPSKNNIDATNSSAPDPDRGLSLRSSTLISMGQRSLSKLNLGGKNGNPRQAIGKNDVLLGNRFFIRRELSFYIRAPFNNEWICIDPELSRPINLKT